MPFSLVLNSQVMNITEEFINQVKEAIKDVEAKISNVELLLFKLEEQYEQKKRELVEKLGFLNGQLDVLRFIVNNMAEGAEEERKES